MNAKAARKIASEKWNGRFNESYLKVKENIFRASNKGEFQVILYEGLMKEVLEKLIGEGFDIDQQFCRNESNITIRW